MRTKEHGKETGKETEQEQKENEPSGKENDGSAVWGVGQEEAQARQRHLLEVQENLRLGDRIFYRHNSIAFLAFVTTDGIKKKPDGTPFVNLCYLDGDSGRLAAVKFVSHGIRDKEWWHDSKELAAAIEFDRRRAKGSI